MRKVLFLMYLLFLMVSGTTNLRAQVRIGGDGVPHNAAVLDLNATDDATPSGNKGALALPRVNLTAANMQLNGTAPVNGMLVYHTGSALDGAGVYVWMTDRWVKASSGSVAYTGSTSIKLEGTSFQREALTGDVTAALNNNVTTIGDGKVTTLKIADKAVTVSKINPGTDGQILTTSGSAVAWGNATGLTSASNGLTTSGATVELGGTLTKATAIATAGNALSITGAGNFYTGDGKVGIGAAPASTSAKFEVKGAAANASAYSAGSSTTIDFSQSNLAYTTANAGAFTLNNLKDGGTYTLAVQGTASGTAAFTATKIGGGNLTVKILNNKATTSGKQTLYTIIVMGTTAYVFVNLGF
ncbi:MAG: hypothetical protein LBC48_09140 [Dysgonamonadaceae bacterium]|jgi:hypothetical protein|nr:hypothetical protein [Dysgonamonadaceae bacterium]